MDPELSDADMEALNKLAEDFEKLNQQWKMRDESRRIEAANKAASMDKKFDRIIALFEKMMPTPTSESERELCVPVETDMVSKGTVVNAVEVDEDSSEPELDSKAAEFYFGEVKVDAMVESVGSASAEIDLASIDVTDKSDSAIATGVFEDGDLDVSTIDSTQTEVTSDLFSADFSSVFVSSDAIIGEWSFETKFCVSNTISDLCLLRVCGNASGNFPLFCAAHRALSDDWYPIQLFHKAFVCLNPPWKPPDSRTHIEFLKLMSLPTPSNYDTEIVINKEDLCIVLKETEAKKGVAITLESMLKIDKLDDYVAELEKGVYGLFESFARLYLLNSSVGQTAGKVGDQLLSTDAEWETARQITNFTKYLNEDKLDKMWQGLFLTSLRVHMIYSSSEAGLVWSTLLKIKFYDHNRIAGKAACHKLSLNVRFGKPPAKPPDDVVLRDVSCCETSNVSHSLSSHLVSCGCHIWYCSEYWDLGLPLIQRQELLVWTTIRICASIFMMVIEDSPDSYRICCLSSSLISLWLSILRYKRCFSWFYKWRMVDGYCALPELKKFMETMIVEANLKMIGQTRVGSYFAHSVVEKVSGTTKYNREDSYLYVIPHPVDYQAVWVFNMDKLDDLHEEQWFKSPSCALSRKLNFCISDAGDSVYQTSFSFSDMLWDLVDHPSTLRHCNDGLILLVWVEKPPPLPPEVTRHLVICCGRLAHKGNDICVRGGEALRHLFVLEVNVTLFELLSLEGKTTASFHLSVGNEDQVTLKFSDVFWPNWKFLGKIASISYVCGYFLNHRKVTSSFVIVYMVAGRCAKDIENLFCEHVVKFQFDMLHPAKIWVNDYCGETLALLSALQPWKGNMGAHSCVYPMFVDENFVYDRGRGYKYNKEWYEVTVKRNLKVKMNVVVYILVLVFFEAILEGLFWWLLKASAEIIWKGTFGAYNFVLEAEITMKRIPTLPAFIKEMICITESCEDGSGSLGDQSKPTHVSKMSLNRLKDLVMLAFKSAFIASEFSLDELVPLICFISKIFLFSLPRPPEMDDLEDKVDFKGIGMLRIGILGKLRDQVVFCV